MRPLGGWNVKKVEHMAKVGKHGTWRLKAFHLISYVAWMGGVLALIALQTLASPSSPEAIRQCAVDQLIIDKVFLIPGGIGIVLTSVLYRLLTNRADGRAHAWIRWKWALTVVLVLIGAGYMGVLIDENAAYTAAAVADGTLDASVYFANTTKVTVAGTVQIVLFLATMHLAITKPKLGRKRS